MKKAFLTILAIVLSDALFATSALADNTWVGDTSSDYNDATNWDSDPANPSGNLFINGAGTTPVVTSTPTWSTVDIIVGDNGTGRLDQTAGTLSTGGTNWAIIGRDANNNGTYNLSGTGRHVTDRLVIGDNVGSGGSGTVTVNTSNTSGDSVTTSYANGGAWWQDSSILLGQGDGSNATLNLENGTISGVNAWVGAWGADGTWNQTGGTANINGIFAVANYEDVQGRTTGTATIENGTVNAGAVAVARNRFATDNLTGVLTVNSGGVLNSEGDLIVGRGGGTESGGSSEGTLNINNGGTVNVASTTERWTIISNFNNAKGVVNVNSGGTLNLNAGTDIQVGLSSSNSSELNVDGGSVVGTGAANDDASGVHLRTDQSTVNVKNGGLIAAKMYGGAAASVVNIDNGTLQAIEGGDFINFTGGGTVNIQTGGATIDSNGHDITVQNALLDGGGGGGLKKTNSGTLTLNGVSTYTGPTVVEGGILSLSSAGSIDDSQSISIAAATAFDVTSKGAAGYTFGGDLSGNGAVTGNLTLASTSTLAPGDSIGTISVTGDLTLMGGTFEVEYSEGAPQEIDLLAVDGDLDITGSTVNFVDEGGGLSDNSYVFATYTGTLTGTFSGLPPTGYTIDYSFGGNAIALVSVPEASAFLAMGLVGSFVACRRPKRGRRGENQ